MSKGIKGLVSKQKRRFKEGGYDLDLTYITDRIIAMGYPAEKLEGVYRNHIDDVHKFLEERHKDHYWIYNLCCERSYDESRFHNRVRRFYFEDHNPPPLKEIHPLCEDIARWLKEDTNNVAVVHCKAGKGRTGVMICCFMLHSKMKLTAKDALDFYDEKRTHDRKGVTIPSQRRYVEYYAKMIAKGFQHRPSYVRLKEARMQIPITNINSEMYMTVSSHGQKGYSSQMSEVKKGFGMVLKVKEEEARPFSGDIKIELRRTNIVRRKERMLSAWLNSHFISEEGTRVANGVEPHQTSRIRQSVCSSSSSNSGSTDSAHSAHYEVITFIPKQQLDKASKDTAHKVFNKDFTIELHWVVSDRLTEEDRVRVADAGMHTRKTSPVTTPSGTSSDEEDEEDEEEEGTDWDSAECVEVLL